MLQVEVGLFDKGRVLNNTLKYTFRDHLRSYLSLSDRKNGDVVTPYAAMLALMSYKGIEFDTKGFEDYLKLEFDRAVKMGAMKKVTQISSDITVDAYQIIDMDYF